MSLESEICNFPDDNTIFTCGNTIQEIVIKLEIDLQWPPKVVGTVAWNCQEIDISCFIVVIHTNSPPSPLKQC